MNHARYTRFVRDLCASAALDDPAPLLESGRFVIEGHAVTLDYDERRDPAHVRVLTDLGELAAAEREEVCRTALEANFHTATPWDGMVCLDPASARLNYLLFFPLDGSRSGGELIGKIWQLVDGREDE
ncbi:hypothetical protein WKR88_00775 [Trinickia caryophylli]|uniref:Tir chaperone protein (CesT) family protein n=1 Tax=Trinickia caryophylli TaxID=28094 RepID=A0A1X7CEM3_TRICW|nr:hypothetical protein [Trinickia caryophylli]PMS12593.1 hypothetical protein C0Z17_09505 [Trinickia caryophylli]TRX19798.1 hypothetical protein FNF07_17365 [Trinickia caryophylli]WQE12872.1 hypothetical protein U0034_05590 [Trinickia caryophylli]SME95287.1 hypothetical protein SAMN06295900_101288 [Trinickia caryophylli]GLU30594.1 hypothetical protein Busp01_04360 [Trinickia caryophylli]